MKQLERRFALKLIERVARKVTPTPAGIELMAHARRLEAVMAGALDAMARHATGALGRVRIGTGATACIHLLPPVLRDLRGRLPSLEIAVSTGNTAHILKLLEDNALDVGLVTLPARGRALSITPVLDDEFVAIASPDAPPLPRRVTPAVLAARPLVLYKIRRANKTDCRSMVWAEKLILQARHGARQRRGHQGACRRGARLLRRPATHGGFE